MLEAELDPLRSRSERSFVLSIGGAQTGTKTNERGKGGKGGKEGERKGGKEGKRKGGKEGGKGRGERKGGKERGKGGGERGKGRGKGEGTKMSNFPDSKKWPF